MNSGGRGWLESLRPGDRVVLRPGGYGAAPRVVRVERRTPSWRLAVEGGLTFNPDGYERRASSRGGPLATLGPLTPDVENALWRAGALARLKDFAWGDLPDDTLRKVLDLLARSPLLSEAR
jgi:hypothetical protein